MSLLRNPGWGSDTAVAVHPGVVNTQLANGFFKAQVGRWRGAHLKCCAKLQRVFVACVWIASWPTASLRQGSLFTDRFDRPTARMTMVLSTQGTMWSPIPALALVVHAVVDGLGGVVMRTPHKVGGGCQVRLLAP